MLKNIFYFYPIEEAKELFDKYRKKKYQIV
jgi:hypothetical protein